MRKSLLFIIVLVATTIVGGGSFSAQCSLTIADIQESSPVSCNGSCDGELLVTFTGEIGNASFVWLDENNNNLNINGSLASGLCAGSYTVTITDDNNCTSDTSFTLLSPAAITSNITRTNTTCVGNTGELAVVGAGGCGGPYQYSRDGGVFQSSGTFSGLAVGFYTITVQDNCGCKQDFTDYVNSTDGPTVITNFTSPLCFGTNDGSITLTPSGTAPFLYSIDGSTFFSTDSTYVNLPPGEYAVAVQDGGSCQTLEMLTINNPSAIIVDPIIVNETCIGNNGSIDLQGSGGTGGLLHSIDGGVVFQASSIFTGLAGGTYNYVVKDDNFCQVTGQKTLTSGDGPTITGSTVLNPVCSNNCNGAISLEVLGNAPINYSINAIGQTTGSFQNLCIGSYTIDITDVDGCITSQNFVLSAPTPPIADFLVSDSTGAAPLTVDFTNLSTGASSYFWDFGDNSSTSILPDPQFTFINGGSYTVMMVASNLLCTDTASYKIDVIGVPDISMPNVFTPNNDGMNDVFRPIVVGAEDIQGKIFNRFGEMIYEWWGINGYWDGYSRPTGQLVPAGAYFYVVTATDIAGETYELSGTVQLMR